MEAHNASPGSQHQETKRNSSRMKVAHCYILPALAGTDKPIK